MSSSTPVTPRFLLDENVRVELDALLKEAGLAVKRLAKGAPDRSLMAASREQQLVVVTNDEDFSSLSADQVFSVVLLRIPQHDVRLLLSAFRTLLTECRRWDERVIVLAAERWKSTPLRPRRGSLPRTGRGR
jgi:predicted nuclease of predicted toxin-antitoxin system